MNLIKKLWIKVKDVKTSQLIINTLLNEYLEKGLIESYGLYDKTTNNNFDFLDERSFYLTFDENFDYFSLCKNISRAFDTKMLCWLAGDFFYFSEDHYFSNDKDPFECDYQYDDNTNHIEDIFKNDSKELNKNVEEWISKLEGEFLSNKNSEKNNETNIQLIVDDSESWTEILSKSFETSNDSEIECGCSDQNNSCYSSQSDICKCEPCECIKENNCGCNMFLENNECCSSCECENNSNQECCCDDTANNQANNEYCLDSSFEESEKCECDDCQCEDCQCDDNACCCDENEESNEIGEAFTSECSDEDCGDCQGCSWDFDENFDHNAILNAQVETSADIEDECEDLSHHFKCTCEDVVDDFSDNESIVNVGEINISDDQVNKIDPIDNIFESNLINSIDVEVNTDNDAISNFDNDNEINLDSLEIFSSESFEDNSNDNDLIPADEFLKLIENNDDVTYEIIEDNENVEFSIDSNFDEPKADDLVNFEDFFAKITEDQNDVKDVSKESNFDKLNEKSDYKDWKIELIDFDNTPVTQNNINVVEEDEIHFDSEVRDFEPNLGAKIEIIENDNNLNLEISEFEKEVKNFFSNEDLTPDVNPIFEEVHVFDSNLTDNLNQNQSFIVEEFKPKIDEIKSFADFEEKEYGEVKINSEPIIEQTLSFEPNISKEKVQVDKKITNDLQKFLEELKFEKEKLRKRKENLEKKTSKIISMFQQLNTSNGFSNN